MKLFRMLYIVGHTRHLSVGKADRENCGSRLGIALVDDICKGLLGNGEGVFLLGGVRDEIHPARQDLAHGADLGGDMLDAV